MGGAFVFALVFGVSVQLGRTLRHFCGSVPLHRLALRVCSARFCADSLHSNKILNCRRYAVFCNLDGKYPDEVPLISNITKNVVDRQTFFDESPNEDQR